MPTMLLPPSLLPLTWQAVPGPAPLPPACAPADYGLLTLVNQARGVTALQVRGREGRWVGAPPLPGTFVVNIGDMFGVLTNGLYTPTPHRWAGWLGWGAGKAGWLAGCWAGWSLVAVCALRPVGCRCF